MKILVYGMQSSGASLFTYLLAQRENTIGVIDLFGGYLAPDIKDTTWDVVLKATISTKYQLADHVESFKPDLKILFTRNREDNFRSLSTKPYRDAVGKIEDKFNWLKFYIRNQNLLFDYSIKFEDLFYDRQKVIDQLSPFLTEEHFAFKRKKEEIVRFAKDNSEWCRLHHNKGWGFGNVHLKSGLIAQRIKFI